MFHASWSGPGNAIENADWVTITDDGSPLTDDELALLAAAKLSARSCVDSTEHDGWHTVNVHGLSARDLDGFRAGDVVSISVALIPDQDAEIDDAARTLAKERAASDRRAAEGLMHAVREHHGAATAEAVAELDRRAEGHGSPQETAVREALQTLIVALDSP